MKLGVLRARAGFRDALCRGFPNDVMRGALGLRCCQGIFRVPMEVIYILCIYIYIYMLVWACIPPKLTSGVSLDTGKCRACGLSVCVKDVFRKLANMLARVAFDQWCYCPRSGTHAQGVCHIPSFLPVSLQCSLNPR